MFLSSLAVSLSVLWFLIHDTAAYNQKPIYHITPEDGSWLNDPNGLGYDPHYHKYHVYSQYNPNNPFWGDMSWAHWISDDLVTWISYAPALRNDQTYDIGGAFSGSSIFAGASQVPLLVYTCVSGDGAQRQCYAYPQNTSDPNYINWVKPSTNPIIDFTTLPGTSNAVQFRDPTLWTRATDNSTNSQWSMTAAAELDGIGHIARYDCDVTTSVANNADYSFTCSYFSSLWNASTESTSTVKTYMIECPDFYPISNNGVASDVYVMKYSVMEDRHEIYELGKYNEAAGQFQRDVATYGNVRLEYDYGPNDNFYASKRFWDTKSQRHLLWGWADEHDDQFTQRNWAGVLSLPRQVTFHPEYSMLFFTPIDELKKLRITEEGKKKQLMHENIVLSDLRDGIFSTNIINGLTMEVSLSFNITYSTDAANTALCQGLEVGVLGRASASGDTYVKHGVGLRKVVSNPEQSLLYTVIDTMKAGGTTPAQVYQKDIPNYDSNHAHLFVKSKKDTAYKTIQVDMRLYYDHSIIEMYVMQGASASTVRVYPDESSSSFSLYTKVCTGDHITLRTMEMWNMKTIWQQEQPTKQK